VAHPSEICKIGDKVRVKVLNFDPEKERISLGLKQLEAYPWEGVEEKYKVGDRVKARWSPSPTTAHSWSSRRAWRGSSTSPRCPGRAMSGTLRRSSTSATSSRPWS